MSDEKYNWIGRFQVFAIRIHANIPQNSKNGIIISIRKPTLVKKDTN
jgi:Flp pilus assembly CpaF family ATPase